MSDRHPSETDVDLRKLDEAVTEAVRLHGGLSLEEHPTEIVVIARTIGWDADGVQFSDRHVFCPGATSRSDVVNLIAEGLGQVATGN